MLPQIHAMIFKTWYCDLNWNLILLGIFISLLIFKIFVLNKKKTVEKIEEHNLSRVDDENDENEEPENNEPAPSLPYLEHIPLKYEKLSTEESLRRSQEFYELMNQRRTVRHFSTEPVPLSIIHNIIKTAGTSPSGAHTEPWTYVLVTSGEIKREIREIVEKEEEINYKRRMGKIWTTDLKPLKTEWVKEYLTYCPCLILLFKQIYSYREDHQKRLHYYNEQSVWLSAGILLTAIHNAGLVALTSTPLNCGSALRKLLGRPANEKLVLLLPIGYPAENCKVPDLKRKKLEDIIVEF